MASESNKGAELAHMLRELRETGWLEPGLTQAQLATAFSEESQVGPATISSWESAHNTKTPNAERLEAYARFFAAKRVVDGTPRLVPLEQLTPAEQEQYQELRSRLLGPGQNGSEEDAEPTERAPSTFAFSEGPITVICPTAPLASQSPLARENDPNFAKLQQYADLDALIEIYGHLRATNPGLDVFHKLASEADADDLSSHVILLGGIAWNEVTERFQEETVRLRLPVRQVADSPLKSGDIFRVNAEEHLPVWKENPTGGDRFLSQDVAFLARLPNPFNHRRTLIICNGIHGRGVLGAVRCLTDKRVRDANEAFLAERFPDGRFALLLGVPVVKNKTMSPDLHDPALRLYEWSPPENGT
jgi:hypothetical protein